MRPSALVSSLSLSSVISATQYINLPLQRHVDTSELLGKRQVSNGSLLINSQASAYLVNITVGTPPQIVQLVLDTGSPLTWVNALNVSIFTPGQTANTTSSSSTICSTNSCLSPDVSTTLRVPSNSTIFDIQYVDGTESIGRIVEDTMSFQGLVDSTFEFGLVEYFYSPQGPSASLGGILGLSPANPVLNFPNLTAALTSTTSTTYFEPRTILEQLKDAGAINNTAFSLYLSDGSIGQLTIGGLDSSRYTGPLTVVPMAGSSSQPGTSYYVTLNAMGFNASTSNQLSVNNVVVLDSGTTSMYLPATVVQQLATNLGGYFIPYDSSSGLLGIPCALSTTIDFYFSNSAVIKVPTGEILEGRLTAAQARKSGLTGVTGDVCILSLFGQANSETYLLGDAFLRSAYVVYDVAQSEIALAQATYGGMSNILTIQTGQFGIPGGVYNSSSPGASNIAVVPTPIMTLTLASGAAGVRTTISGAGTLTFSSATMTGTETSTGTATAKSGGIKPVSNPVYRWASISAVILVVASILFA